VFEFENEMPDDRKTDPPEPMLPPPMPGETHESVAPPIDATSIALGTYDRTGDVLRAVQLVATDMAEIRRDTRGLARLVANSELQREQLKGFQSRLGRLEARLIRLEKRLLPGESE
jgi:hypothetical protein